MVSAKSDALRSLRVVATTAAVLLVAAACGTDDDGVFEPPPGTIVRTASLAYDVPPGFSVLTIPATVTNSTAVEMYLDGLGRDFMALEKLVGGEWTMVYSPIYIAIAVPPILLAPGESRSIEFGIVIGHFSERSAPALEDVPGRYRAAFVFGRPAPANTMHARSNEFELRQSAGN